jgi:hypothetical protein
LTLKFLDTAFFWRRPKIAPILATTHTNGLSQGPGMPQLSHPNSGRTSARMVYDRFSNIWNGRTPNKLKEKDRANHCVAGTRNEQHFSLGNGRDGDFRCWAASNHRADHNRRNLMATMLLISLRR